MVDKDVIERVKEALLSMQRLSWEQGVAAQAFFEIGDVEMGILMAKEAVHRQLADGRLGIASEPDKSTDPGANGGPVLQAYNITGDKSFKVAADKMIDWFLKKAPRTKEGILYHYVSRPRVLIDSIYHTAPFLALAGYDDEAIKQIKGYRKLMWNPQKKLYSHIWDDDAKDFGRRAFWGGGNGWAAAAIVRVIKALPEKRTREKLFLAEYLKEGIDGCLAYQREDGLFHDIIDDPSTFVETTAALMICYSIYRGIEGGWLPRKYLKHANRIREVTYKMVNEFGIVQGACGAPYFNRRGTSAESQAFFLLVEAAYRDSKS